jgi:hypothetical protein
MLKLALVVSEPTGERTSTSAAGGQWRARRRGNIERLCLIAKIEEGLRQSEAGQLTDHEEVEKRFLA